MDVSRNSLVAYMLLIRVATLLFCKTFIFMLTLIRTLLCLVSPKRPYDASTYYWSHTGLTRAEWLGLM